MISICTYFIICRDTFRLLLCKYQDWFEEAMIYWLQTFRCECIQRMGKALEIDQDVSNCLSTLVITNFPFITFPSHYFWYSYYKYYSSVYPTHQPFSTQFINGPVSRGKCFVVGHSSTNVLLPHLNKDYCIVILGCTDLIPSTSIYLS